MDLRISRRDIEAARLFQFAGGHSALKQPYALPQELLKVCKKLADNHRTDIATIASAWVLKRQGVKAVIVGARNISHINSNLQIPQIVFTEEELALIDEVLAQSKGPDGPVYELERYSEKHRTIMHTNNN